MADYYPLIARAVATVKDAPAETRAQVYDRARAALMKHLRNAQPPLSPDAIEREDSLLDEAIARVEAEILSGDAPGADPDPRPTVDETAADADADVVRRPLAPIARLEDPTASHARKQRWRLLVTGVVVASIAGAIALLAVSQKEDPARYAAAPDATQTDAAGPAAGPKIGERVSGDPADSAGGVNRRTDVASAPVPPSQPPPELQQPQVAVAQRAILYEQQPETPNEPTVVTGRAVWRLESVAPSQNDAPETVVKVDLEFPERSMNVEMMIRRNMDAALPASHLVEIKFQFRAGGGPVKELASPPTMKLEENQRGSPLLALQVPVMENYFLVGLSNLPADIERNISQLQSANWIDLPFRFANDRIGVIAIEKGVQGTEALSQALARWRG